MSKNNHWFDNENLLKMTSFFSFFFISCRKIEFFGQNLFFTDFVSQDLPFCQKSDFYIKNSIFIDFYRKLPILEGPLTLGPLIWPPYEPALSQKKFKRVRKIFIGFYRKFQVDTPNDKKKLSTKRTRG